MHTLKAGHLGMLTFHRLSACGLALLILLLQGCGKEQAAAGFGLELHKPTGWTYVSAGVSGAKDDTVSYDAATLAKAIDSHASAPLFALLKRAPPQHTMNPTFGINLDRSPATLGQTPLALLETRVARATDNGPFVAAQAAAASKLAGLDAAHAELRSPPGKGLVTRVRLDLVVIGDVTVLLAATDTPSGADDASAEFTQIVESLRLPGAVASP
jgi:hypothetical protein